MYDLVGNPDDRFSPAGALHYSFQSHQFTPEVDEISGLKKKVQLWEPVVSNKLQILLH